MNLDLSALDDVLEAPGNGPSNGKPNRAPLDRFYEDIHQPRKEFPEEKMTRFAAELKRRGVMSAIIVAPADNDGRMRIIHGARRYRGSQLAGLADIPYVVAEDMQIFDSYSQVAENEQRESLTPMELANFIIERIEAGDKKKYIAENIGIDQSDVTHLVSLFEGPDFIKELYFSNKCRTPKYLYELTNLAKEFPVEVELFCGESDDFTRKAIVAFTDSLKKPKNKGPEDSTKLDLDRQINGGGNGAGDSSSANGTQHLNGSEPDGAGLAAVTHIPGHNPDNEKDSTKEPALRDPSKIKKPLLLGTYEGRDVMVQLYTRPTTPGLVHVKYEDGSGELEISFSQISNLTLTESAV